MTLPESTPDRPSLRDEIGKRDPFASPQQEAYLNLLRTADVLQAEFQRLFKSCGLSNSLYNALRIVVGAGRRGVPVRTIGDRMVVREPDVSRLVDRLEHEGLVHRKRCKEDRRVVWVCATAAGTRKVRSLDDAVAGLHERQLGHMTRRDLRQLSELLADARRHVGESGDEPRMRP